MTPALIAFGLTFLTAIGPVPLGIVKIVDFVKGRFQDANGNSKVPSDVWLVLALLLGVGYAFLTKTNLTTLEGAPAGIANLTGGWAYLVSGLGVGGVASYWYEKTSALKAGSAS